MHQKFKWRNNLRFFLGDFVIVASWTFVIKNLSNDEWTKEKTKIIIYVNVQVSTLKILNIKVYMDIKLCIYEHFDLIFNSNINVKHKQVFMHPFAEIIVSAKCN
jgi:hypothetical protein